MEIFKAQNGIMSRKFTPVIKKVRQTTIKLTPLDIPMNDYLAEIFEDKDEPISAKNFEKSESTNNIASNHENDYNDNYIGKLSQLLRF